MSNKPKIKGKDIPPMPTALAEAAADAVADGVVTHLAGLWPDSHDDERYKRFIVLVVENNKRGRMNAMQGAELDGEELKKKRLEMILEALMPLGSDARLDFELSWQEMIATSIDGMEAEVRRINLTRNMQPPTGLVIPRV